MRADDAHGPRDLRHLSASASIETGRPCLRHRLRRRLEQPHHAQAGLAVGHRRRLRSMQSTKCAASTCSASVSASCGAHMSPVR